MTELRTNRRLEELTRMLDSCRRLGWEPDPVLLEQVDTGAIDGPERCLDALAARSTLTEAQRYRAYADAVGLPFVDIDWIRPDEQLLSLAPIDEWLRHRSFPLKCIHGALELATAKPRDANLTTRLQSDHGLQVQRLVAAPSQVDQYLALAQVSTDRVRESLARVDAGALAREAAAGRAADSGVRELADELVLLARKRRASNVHIEPLEASTASGCASTADSWKT